MMTPRFTSKLDSLIDTLSLLRGFDCQPLADALYLSCGRPAIAVGSGGSQVAASYFARCRTTLQHGLTLLQTPMELVYEMGSLKGCDVWLFSASADNSDLAAAAKAAKDRGCDRIIVCTRNSGGRVAQWVLRTGGVLFTVPVAEAKDGFLATHSLFASIIALLLASDLVSGGAQGSEQLIASVQAHLEKGRDPEVREKLARIFSTLTPDMTLIVLADPRMATAALLIETSIWETALCAVQTTDVRNFAHGRHTWLHHRAPESFVLSVIGEGSDVIWRSAQTQLPSTVSVFQSDYGACGRLANVSAVIDGLSWIEVMGATVGVDPGKPGVGKFGRAIYSDPILQDVGHDLTSAVRHKRAATDFLDSTGQSVRELSSAFETKLSAMCEAEIVGLVLDYDGTVVSTKDRQNPPDPKIVQELLRLHREGVAIAFASGRGKSLGVAIRDAFPEEVAQELQIGYYNGSYLKYANVDISVDRPTRDMIIDEIEEWFENQDDLIEPNAVTFGARQVEVNRFAGDHPHFLEAAISACPAIAEKRAKIVWSGHSFDIIPCAVSKLRVVEVLEENIKPEQAVISIGDCGAANGNDYALLNRTFGISVNAVCSGISGSWSIYGQEVSGPDALLRILCAMVFSETGGIRLSRAALRLVRMDESWCET